MKHPAACICLTLILLGGCGDRPEADPVALGELQINSAKRQCVSVAVIQQVPREAAKDICDCAIDTLVEAGQMTASKMPSDQEQQTALDACIDRHGAGETPGAE